MNKRNLVLALAAVGACVVITAAALSRTQVSHVKFADLPNVPADQRAQVYGVLDADSIRSVKGATTVRFELIEEKTGRRLEVLYDNPSIALPATFPAASHAKVSGAYVAAEQRFIGDSVQTKCPSKYDEKQQLDLARKDAVERWQKVTGLRAETGG
jgi:cytochrome c-type biogenesis protein CcmE